MSLSLECAAMLQTIADMTPRGEYRSALLAQRDECLEAAKAELAHEARMARILFSTFRDDMKFSGGAIEIPISYE